MSGATPTTATVSPMSGFKRFWRTLKQLFYEITGALFAFLAFGWINAAFRAWTRDVSKLLVWGAVAVALLFFFFAVTSFRRAKKL
jgi:multisubunit Na+/H+ antiporter MnhB subunit